eukprot:493053_1
MAVILITNTDKPNEFTHLGKQLSKLQIQIKESITRHQSYISDLGNLIETIDEDDKKQSNLQLHLDLPSTCIPTINNTNSNWSIQQSPLSACKSSRSPLSHSPISPSISSVQYSAYSSSISDIDYDSSSSFDLNEKSEQIIDDNIILNKYGYTIDKPIKNTLNGCVYLANIAITNNRKLEKRNNIGLNPSPLISSNYNNMFGTDTCKQIVIKKYDKDNEIISNENEDNPIKEAIILNYLTVKNNSPSNNICKYLDFIETQNAYYLVEEYGGSMSLNKFISIAHKYIKEKKLKSKNWRIVIKYLFWQLVVTLYWMHNDMK